MNIRIGLVNVTICLTSYGPWNHQWTTWPQETLCISSKTWESNGYVHVFVLSYAFPLLSLLFLKEEEDRLGLIDHHNRELLSRMHHIMHTTGRVDHRNQDWRPKKRCVYVQVSV